MIFLSTDINFYNIKIIFILLLVSVISVNRRDKVNIMIYRKCINFIDNFKILI